MSDLEDADFVVGERGIARSFRQALVENAIDAVLTPDLLDSCTQDQLSIIVNAPTETWANALMGPLSKRCEQFPARTKPFVFKRAPARRLRVEKGDPDFDTVMAKLMSGTTVLGVFCPGSEPFPLLTDFSDMQFQIVRPSYADVARALAEALGEEVRADQIPPVNTTDLDALSALVRPRASLQQTLFRLCAASDTAAKNDGIPTLHELAGYGEAKEWALKALRVLEAIRAGDPEVSLSDLPRGALLVGPPGVGKSIFAQSLAKTLNIPSVITSVSNWLSHGDTHLGTVIAAARAAIEKAASFQPGLLFIDEVDSLVDRDLESSSSASWWINFINSVLTAIDGAVKTPGLIVVGACNDLNRVDKALKRSGRLETVVHIGLPNQTDRLSIFEFYVKGAVGREALKSCAIRAAGMSGADIQRIVREAKQGARDEGRRLAVADLHAAMAPRSRLNQAEHKLVARHEAGHALASLMLDDRLIAVDVDRGVTHLKPLASVLSGSAIDQALSTLMAGRAADQLLSGEVHSGAGGALVSDLGQATSLAAARHIAFGLGGTLVFLGSIQDALRLLEADRDLRARVERDLQDAYDRTVGLLAHNEGALRALADELARRRFMHAEEIAELVAKHEVLEP